MADLTLNVTLAARNRGRRTVTRAVNQYREISQLTKQIAINSRRVEQAWKRVPRQAQRANRAAKQNTRETVRQTRAVKRQVRSSKRLTRQEARRGVLQAHRNKLARERAKIELGLGKDVRRRGRGGISGDPDAPAINLAIAGGALSGVGQQLGQVNRAAIGESIALFSSFEEAMANVAAKGGTDLIDQQTELARKLGRDTRFSAIDAAGGLTFLSQAGFKAQERMDALPGILDLATATSSDLARTADITSNILSGFGIEADETARVVDVLTTAVNKSNTDLDQFGDAMRNVAPLARKLGVDVEQTAAFLGVLGDAGIQGGRAGTAAKIVLQRIAAPTGGRRGRAQTALRKVGVSETFRKGQITAGTPEAILEQISKGLKGKEVAEQAAIIKDIFGEEALSSASALLAATEKNADGVSAYSEKLDQNRKSMGAASEGAAELTKTLKASTERLQNTLGDIGITFGEVLAPDIKKLSDSLSNDLLPGIQKWVKQNPEMAKGVAGLSLGAQGIASAGGGLLNIGAGLAGIQGFVKQGGLQTLTSAAKASSLALGKTGLVLAAAGAGFALGTLIDDTFKISDALSNWADRLTGDDETTEKIFGATAGQVGVGDTGLLAKRQQQLEAVTQARKERFGSGLEGLLGFGLVGAISQGTTQLDEEEQRLQSEVRRLETKGGRESAGTAAAAGFEALKGALGIKIKVDQSGRVTDATLEEAPSGADVDLEMDMGTQ